MKTSQKLTAYFWLFILALILTGGAAHATLRTIPIAIQSGPVQSELSDLQKDSIWLRYVRSSEGDWLNYTFNINQRPLGFSHSKTLATDLLYYFQSKGMTGKNVVIKYSPNASIVVYKEPGLAINANFIELDPNKRQFFYFKNGDGAKCHLQSGNQLLVPKNAFKCSSEAEVQFEVFEMKNKRDFFDAGYTASADGKLLESRGMYKMQAFSNNTSLELKQGKQCELKFHKDNFDQLSEASTFHTFYGNQNDNIVDWEINHWEKIRPSVPSDDGIKKVEAKKGRRGRLRIKRTMIYTETTYYQLCKKRNMLTQFFDANEGCLLSEKKYKRLIKKHGKLHTSKNKKLKAINSYKEYLRVNNSDPNKVLVGFSKEQMDDIKKKQKEEKAKQEAYRNSFTNEEEMYAAERAKQLEEERKNFPVSMKISKLGNINCDRFDAGSKKTNILVELDDFNYNQIKVYAVFNDIKSVIHGYYRPEHKGIIKFDNLPVGRDVTYIAATFKGNQVKLAYLSKVIGNKDHLKLKLKSYTRDNYNRILDDLIPDA